MTLYLVISTATMRVRFCAFPKGKLPYNPDRPGALATSEGLQNSKKRLRHFIDTLRPVRLTDGPFVVDRCPETAAGCQLVVLDKAFCGIL